MMSESVMTDPMSVDTNGNDEDTCDGTIMLENRQNDQLDSSTTKICQLEEHFLTNQLEQLKIIETIVRLQISEMKSNQQQNEYQLHDENEGNKSSFIDTINKLRKYHSEQLQKIQQFQSHCNKIRMDDEQYDDDTADFLLSPNVGIKGLSMIGGQTKISTVQLNTIIGRLDSVIETDNETDSVSLNSMVSSNLDTIGMTQSSPSISVTSAPRSIGKTKLSVIKGYNESIHDAKNFRTSDDTKPTRSVEDELPVTPPVTLNLSFATSHLLIQSIRKQQIAEAKREWEETTQNIRFEEDINNNDNDTSINSTKNFEHRRVYPTTPYQHKDSILDDIDDEIDDDDDDSALYCATIVAKRSSNVSSSNWKGTTLRNYVTGKIPTSAQKRSGRQSSFSVLDVDVTDTSSPTSTNITMDTISNTLNDLSLEKESDTGTLGNVFAQTMRQLPQLPPIATNMSASGQPKTDDLTPKAANSMLDYFRVEPDEASPHGFRVVPCSYDKSATATEKWNHGTTGSKTSFTNSNAGNIIHERNDYNSDESSMMSGSDISNTPSDSVSYRKPKTYRRTPYPKKSQLETMMESPSETDSLCEDNSMHQSQCAPILNTRSHRLSIPNDESPDPSYQRSTGRKNSLSNGSTQLKHRVEGSAKNTVAVVPEDDKENGYPVNYSNRRSHVVMEPKTIKLTPRKSLDNSFINTYQRRSEVKNGNVRMKTIRKDEYKQMSSELSQQIPLSHLQTACDAFNYAIRQQQRKSVSSTHDTIGHFSILDAQRLLESFQFKDQVYQCQLIRVLHHFCRLDILDTQEPNGCYNAKVEMMVTNDRRLSSLLQSALTVGGNRYMIYVIPEND